MARAQFVLSTGSMGLGGGGSAHLSGIEAAYHNPANTYFLSKETFQIRLFTVGVRYDPMIPRSTLPAYVRQYRKAFSPYKPAGSVGITPKGRFLSFNYPEQTSSARFFNKFETIPLSVRFHNESYSLTLSLRSHTTSRFRVGRGWYTDEPQKFKDDLAVVNRTLSQRFQTFHELSLAYAQPLTFLNGLTPSFNRWYIGLAPKIIFGGSMFNAHYIARYHQQEQQLQVKQRSLYLQSSGTFSRAIRQMKRGDNAWQAIQQHLSRASLLRNTGYGFGVNFGLTYQHLFDTQQETDTKSKKKSLLQSDRWRFSIALRDVGFFRQTHQPLTFRFQGDTTQVFPQKSLPLAPDFFTGAPGQYLYYLKAKTPAPDIIKKSHSKQKAFLHRLSGRFQVGTKIIFSNISVTGDASIPISNQHRIDPPFTFNGGIVFYPLEKWELQSGIQFITGQPALFSLGTSFHNDNWSVSTALQVSAGDQMSFLVPRGAALTTITMQL